MNIKTIPQENFSTSDWHRLEDDRLQCDLCPRACKLREGQRGLCYIRGRKNHQIVLWAYGRSSGFAIDPIEKKPLFHFLPGTPVFSFGTIGCNFACQFCQNANISKPHTINILSQTASPKTIVEEAERYKCPSVAFTYNEPIISMEYVIDVAEACHQKNIQTVAVTAGYICKNPREKFFRYIDAANVDLKGFTEDFYTKIVGGHLQPVLDTLMYIRKETNIWLEITTLLIPDLNDSDTELDHLTSWVAQNLGIDTPLHFSAFHPAWKMMDRRPTPSSTLIRARNIAQKNGLHHVYIGNVPGILGQSTFCHHCQREIIKRESYRIMSSYVNSLGECTFCSEKCPGIFR